MEIYKIDKSLVINDREKCLNVLNNDNNIYLWINGKKATERLMGFSFKITSDDRNIYEIFNELFNSLVDEYNAFKDFNDYEYEKYPLYDKTHNWFTFYDDYSNIADSNFLRIIKNENKRKPIIGLYIKNKNNISNSHVFTKTGSKYPQFTPCFLRSIKSLEKLEKENKKSYIKIMEGNN